MNFAELQETRATIHFALGMATDEPQEEERQSAASALALSAAISVTERTKDVEAWRRRQKALGGRENPKFPFADPHEWAAFIVVGC